MDNELELYELCKEVYERTKWGDETVDSDTGLAKDTTHGFGLFWEEKGHPLYTSDYILDMLPSFYFVYKGRSGEIWYPAKITGGLTIKTPPHIYEELSADTSRKALLRLVLALHKEGLLK